MKFSYLTYAAVAILGASVAVAGCNGDTQNDDDGSGGTGGSGGQGPGPGPGAGGMDPGDGNDSFEEAEGIQFDTDVFATLEPPGTDEDYYSFTLQAGDVIFVDTAAKPENDAFNPAFPDLVVTIYDEGETKVAENDDPYLSRTTNDSQVIYRAATAGTHYVRVTDCINWDLGGPDNCAPADGITTPDYGLRVSLVDGAEAGSVEDAEGGNDQNTSPNVVANTEWVSNPAGNFFAIQNYGTFANETDVDVFEITIPATATLDNRAFAAIFIWGPEGPNGIGTTNNIGDAWVTNAAGDIVAQIDHRLGHDVGPDDPPLEARDLQWPISENFPTDTYPTVNPTYFVHVEHPGGGTGNNDWYSFNLNAVGANPQETPQNDTDNDAGAGVTLTTAPNPQNADLDSAFIGGDLADGNEDRWSVDTTGHTGTFSVACGALRSGSGAVLTIEVLNEAGASIAGPMTETEDEDFAITDIDLAGATLATVVLSGATPQENVTSRYYSCGIHKVAPMP